MSEKVEAINPEKETPWLRIVDGRLVFSDDPKDFILPPDGVWDDLGLVSYSRGEAWVRDSRGRILRVYWLPGANLEQLRESVRVTLVRP